MMQTNLILAMIMAMREGKAGKSPKQIKEQVSRVPPKIMRTVNRTLVRLGHHH
jgi:hypothetical protein